VIRTLAATTIAVLAGAAAAAGLYWGFLSTPESTVVMLVLSALLALAFLTLVAATVNTLLLAWSEGGVSGAVVRKALRQVPAAAAPLLLVAAAWWLVLRADGWVQMRSGEISAWFIARFGWGDVGWLFRTIEWLSLWLRWVLAPFIGLVWWRHILSGTWRPTRMAVREALHPLSILAATAILLVLVWAPWTQVVPWRPRGITPGTAELLFVGGKLGLVAVLSALASTLLARTASGRQP
jgi:hypothetical protein